MTRRALHPQSPSQHKENPTPAAVNKNAKNDANYRRKNPQHDLFKSSSPDNANAAVSSSLWPLPPSPDIPVIECNTTTSASHGHIVSSAHSNYPQNYPETIANDPQHCSYTILSFHKSNSNNQTGRIKFTFQHLQFTASGGDQWIRIAAGNYEQTFDAADAGDQLLVPFILPHNSPATVLVHRFSETKESPKHDCISTIFQPYNTDRSIDSLID